MADEKPQMSLADKAKAQDARKREEQLKEAREAEERKQAFQSHRQMWGELKDSFVDVVNAINKTLEGSPARIDYEVRDTGMSSFGSVNFTLHRDAFPNADRFIRFVSTHSGGIYIESSNRAVRLPVTKRLPLAEVDAAVITAHIESFLAAEFDNE